MLLSAAAQRDDRSFYPLPGTLAKAGPRVTKALAGLVSAGFVEERDTSVADQIARSDGDLTFGLFVTPAGLAAIGVDGGAGVVAQAEVVPPSPAADVAPQPAAPRVTKTAAVVALLAREQGATLAELIAATGWLPHTTRAALTGLRKNGHAIERSKRDEATCYRIAARG